MKKLVVMLTMVAVTTGAYAWYGCHGYHHYHHHSCWGHGGEYFWPGFVGGVVGGAVASAFTRPAPVVVTQPVVTTPVVVSQPVIVTQPAVVAQPTVVSQPVVATPAAQPQTVWVEGRYIDQVQANGSVTRVWNPGHYEQR